MIIPITIKLIIVNIVRMHLRLFEGTLTLEPELIKF